MEPPRGILASLWNFICFLPFFNGLLLLGVIKGLLSICSCFFFFFLFWLHSCYGFLFYSNWLCCYIKILFLCSSGKRQLWINELIYLFSGTTIDYPCLILFFSYSFLIYIFKIWFCFCLLCKIVFWSIIFEIL